MLYSGVIEKKEKKLIQRMQELGINEYDIVEKFIRSQGHGGQHLNKTSTCVYLKHLPTSIEVKMQRERSQSLNRFLARRLLVDKIEEQIKGRQSKIQREIEKIKRQKRKRSKRAKEKLLVEKRLHSIKKSLREKVTDDV